MAEDFLGLGGGGSVEAGQDEGGLVFNLNDVEEDKGFELIPKGNYPAIVDSLEFTESSTGNPMIAVQYKITEGEFEGRVLFDYWVLAGKGAEFGLGKLKKFLTRVCPEVNLSAFNPQTFADEGTAIGRELVISVRIQTQKKGEYKGEKRNQVADILAPSTGSFI